MHRHAVNCDCAGGSAFPPEVEISAANDRDLDPEILHRDLKVPWEPASQSQAVHFGLEMVKNSSPMFKTRDH